jgi:hypothetical protein
MADMQKRTPSPTPSMRRRVAAGALLATLVLGAAACGDDDDENAAGSGTPGTDADAGDDNVDNGFGDEACDAYLELNAAFAAAPQDPAEMQAFGESLVPIVDALVSGLPEALAADGETLQRAVGLVAEDGNPEAMFSPEGAQAQANIGFFAFDECDGEQLAVEAADYSFDGVPAELPAGRVNVQFRNVGTEEHEVIVLRRNDGSDVTFEELMAQGPEAMFAEATFAGVAFAAPSETGYTALDLEAGTYFLVCTIPTGGAEDGEPHFVHGMHQTVEVA